MLQNLFYLSVILLAVILIIFLLVFLYIIIRTFLAVKRMIENIEEKANQINAKVSEVREIGSDLLQLATKEGQRAASASTILSILMNSYFFLRTIFKKRA